MSFDPYHQWLGIPPDEQPPHFYRLLGLPLYESNGETIGAAADKQMLHLRTFQIGKYSADSQRLMNEVSAARVCLLNPKRKATYDEQLKAFIANQNALANPSELPPSLPDSPIYGQPANMPPGYGVAPYPADPYQANPYPHVPYPGMAYPGGPIPTDPYQTASYPGQIPYAYPTEPAYAPPVGEYEHPPVGAVAEPSVRPNSPEPLLQSVETPAAVSAVQKSAVPLQLETEHAATKFRKQRAKSLPVETIKVVIGGVVGSIAAIVILLFAFQKDPLGIRPASKTVVSKGSTKSNAHVHAPAVTATNVPANDLVEPKATPSPPIVTPVETAQEPPLTPPVTETPKSNGSTSVTKVPETKTPETKTPVPKTPETVVKEPPPAPVTPPVQKPPAQPSPMMYAIGRNNPTGQKMPPPSPKELGAVAARINQTYPVTDITTREEKKTLIQTITDEAKEKTESPIEYYALLRKALEIAESRGDSGEASKIVNKIAADFEIDSLSEREQAFTKLLPIAHDDKGEMNGYIRRAKGLIWEAMAAARYDIAKRTTEATVKACVNNPVVADKEQKFVVSGGQAVAKLCDKRDEYQSALKTLEMNPEDRKAHRTAGIWLCIYREEWPEGLIHLAKSGDKHLGKLAEDDLANPTVPVKQLKLVDGWHEASQLKEFQKTAESERMELRAFYWYLQAISKLSKLDRNKYEPRYVSRMGSLWGSSLQFAERLVLWNSPYSLTDDRATRACHVSLLRGDELVWQKRDCRLDHQASTEASTEINLPAIAFDKIRIDVAEWYMNGAALAEIQVFHNNKNIALGRKPNGDKSIPTFVPIALSPKINLESLTNGDIPKRQLDEGYWFLNNKTVGGVEISFKDMAR